MPGSARVRGALLLIGFTSVTAQVVLMRELIVTFYGNEMSLGVMLACWLLWTAVGSGLLDRATSNANPNITVAVLEFAVAAGLPAAILIVRESKGFFQTATGQVLGFGPMCVTAFVALGVFCPLSGWLFPAGSRALRSHTGGDLASNTTSVYMLEAIGSAAGGLAASIALIRWLSPFEIAAVLAGLNIFAALALLNRKVWVAAAAATAAVPALIAGARAADSVTLARFWAGFRLLATQNSPYGNLAVLETEGSRSLAENGLIVATVPDPAAAEESMQFPLLVHHRPEQVLLVGGGVNGSIGEALKHGSIRRIDYVELDPAVPELARRLFPNAIPKDARVVLHNDDGRRFVAGTRDTYDVVVVDLPEPQTAQLNRFYTEEFLREASMRLREGGILAVSFPASENYISPESAAFLRCIQKTFTAVFPHVSALPGETVHVFGSRKAIAADSETIIGRLRDRGIQTQYVNEHFLPFRLAPDRVQEFSALIKPDGRTPVNRDLSPIAYYFDLTLWSARFGSMQATLFETAGRLPLWALGSVGVLVLLGLAVLLRSPAAALCTGTTGFTMIGVEVMLLIGFQALYGYVYHQLAILVSAFMAGMAAGAWVAIWRPLRVSLGPVQAIVAITPLAVIALLPYGATVVALVAVVAGVLGGYQFGIASRAYLSKDGTHPGALYAVDLGGSCVGALLVSAYTIPVFGFLKTAFLIGFLNLVPTLAAFARRTPAR